MFASKASRAQLLDRVHQLEDAGVDGISIWDHMFCALDKPRRDAPMKPCDPLTTLAAIAGISDRLTLQTVVMNTAWAHPALLLRQFNQLAVVVGGERVSARLGAGWNNEEFDALGVPFPKFKQRMDRLRETLQIARELYTHGHADFKGAYLEANDLPLSPVPEVPPRLLVGGGSNRVLEIAGRYCDGLDIHGDPRHGRMEVQGSTELHLTDVRLRALITVSGLGERVEIVRDVAEKAGRSRNAVGISVSAWHVTFGGKSVVDDAERHICEHWGRIPYQSLADNPYRLFGEPQQMADTHFVSAKNGWDSPS